MVSLLSEFYIIDLANYGEKTLRSVYAVSDDEAKPKELIGAADILVRREGVINIHRENIPEFTTDKK